VVLLHTDSTTGGMDLLVRFPAGHVIAPHFHDSNERVIVVEGQLTLRQDSGDSLIDAGIRLPARAGGPTAVVHVEDALHYLAWDGKPDSRPAK
jgi:uncharacterized cupin superfamily protein